MTVVTEEPIIPELARERLERAALRILRARYSYVRPIETSEQH
jgi:hypothetical protein